VEVGLGGRLDATNLVQPSVSVITPISLDHVHILGDSIAKIAFEKAGIIKPGAPAVIGRQEPQARAVFDAVAAKRGAPLVDALARVALLSEAAPSEGPQQMVLRGQLGEYRATLPLLGAHQVDNARTAVAALEQLHGRCFDISPDAVARGLAGVTWPARAEIVSQGPPLVLADGAHNDASALALTATVRRHFEARSPVVFLIGATLGHDFAATARVLARTGGQFVVTQSRHPKAVPAAEFSASLVRERIEVAAVTRNAADGLAEARKLAPGRSGIIVATGSLFIAAEVRELVLGIEPELYPDLKGALTQPYEAPASLGLTGGHGRR
jgi:dihydrofolate synthase/folylpolyglutamate synthase